MSTAAELVLVLLFTAGIAYYFVALIWKNAAEKTYGSWHCRWLLALFIFPPSDPKRIWANYLRLLAGCSLMIALFTLIKLLIKSFGGTHA